MSASVGVGRTEPGPLRSRYVKRGGPGDVLEVCGGCGSSWGGGDHENHRIDCAFMRALGLNADTPEEARIRRIDREEISEFGPSPICVQRNGK
jgi:hypothetical protein